MKISEEQRKEINRLLDQGRPLPDKYRFLLFDRHGDAELVWDGKSSEVCNVRLPFQTIEQVDEPRDELMSDIFDSDGRQLAGWTNKLIWGDNKLVLSSLATGEMRDEIERAGGLKLVYIDPPFDVGADFSMSIEIGGEEFVKEPNMLEEIAYRDTWGKRENSYIAMMYERLRLIYDLLADDGSIYVHCDWRVNSYMRLVLDEVFGRDNFVNEISWKRYAAHSLADVGYDAVTDTIFMFAKDTKFAQFNAQYGAMTSEEEAKRFPHVEQETGRQYQHVALEQSANASSRGESRTIQGREVSTNIGWRWTQETFDDRIRKNQHIIHWTRSGRPRYKVYADEYSGSPLGDIWTDIPYLSAGDQQRLGYPTQKPEALLERIIKASSNEGDLVADFFCGSGTTAAVAEKLGRKWIAADLGRFAIHTTRKRLINVQRQMKADHKDYRAFALLNLGKYERQYFVADNNPRLSPEAREAQAAKKWSDYARLILRAYHAREAENDPVFHGQKSGKMIAVGPLSLPASRAFAKQVVDECKKRNLPGADILAFEFEMGLCPQLIDTAKKQGVSLSLKYIPPEVFDKRAVEKGQVAFYDVAYIAVQPHIKKSQNGREIRVELAKFSTHYSQDNAKPGKVVVRDGQVYKIAKDGTAELLTKNWHDWVDYWAVDFDYESRPATVRVQNDAGKWENRTTGDFIFENEWQSFRTRKNRALELTSAPRQIPATPVKIAVKVVDLFGNDTMKVLEV